jgi:hypothetical protein
MERLGIGNSFAKSADAQKHSERDEHGNKWQNHFCQDEKLLLDIEPTAKIANSINSAFLACFDKAAIELGTTKCKNTFK